MRQVLRTTLFVAMSTVAAFAATAGSAPTPCADLAEWRNDGAGASTHWRNDGATARIDDEGTRVFAAALVSPPFTVPDGGLAVSWQQRRDLSWANSAGVLDVAIDGGSWRDVTTVGARFDEGSYDGRAFAGNPLGARAAWGPQPRAAAVLLELPATLARRTIRLRFRFGSGGTGDARAGWLISDLRCEALR